MTSRATARDLQVPGRETLDEMGPGNPISPGVRSPVSFSSCYDLALRLLEFRARTVEELRRKLIQKGAPGDDVDAVIARLLEQKLLDDTNFARQFARARVLGAGASRRRILLELKRKGVASSVADEAIDALEELEGIDPSASIHRVAAKKLKSLGALDDVTRKRRLYAFLARRGFDPDEIREAMAALGRDPSG
jgi:regulatory protein